jgi:uncharacterized membrane protein YqgA involved in biofilm formation
MFIGLGSVINAATIIIGSTLGVFFGSKLNEKIRELIMSVLGLITACAAADMLKHLWDYDFRASLPKGWPLIAVLLSLIIGGIMGSIAKVEDRLENFGERLRRIFSQSSDSRFIEGFVTSSLIFVVGPMAILGGISDGMKTGIQTLVLKSVLDGIAAMAFAASLGWGVAASSIPTTIYQLGWTAIGFILGNILAPYQITAITVTGGILIMCISLRLLRVKQIPIGNLLPALFVAPILVQALHHFVS